MKVAVPREKHSPRFGQRASSHTVWSPPRRRSTRTPRAPRASGLLLRAHSGRRTTGSAPTVYCLVIMATVIFQGLNARYYYRRVERLEEHVHRTPSWALDLQRAGRRT